MQHLANNINRYFIVWKIIALNAVQETFVNRWTNVLFMFGKFMRFAMSLVFLLLLKSTISGFAGYTTDQVILFYLVYQLIDIITQAVFRGVYQFGQHIRTGNFDFYLTRPIRPLFQALMGKPDINDVVFLIPVLAITFYLISTLNITITLTSLLLFLFLLFNSFLIATAFHIIVLACAILIVDVDGILWLYRDLTRLGQFPVTIYYELMRFILFFIIPVGMMITIPTEVLLATNPTYSIGLTTLIGVSFFVLSLLIWNWSLKHYSSASS